MSQTVRSVATIVVVVLITLSGCSGLGNVTDQGPTPDSGTSPESPTSTDVGGPPPASGTLEVHFINVDQSVSTLLISPSGETMLIDTGHFQDDGRFVIEYLQDHDIDRLDHLVTSHNDADHIGGNAAIIEYFETEADGIGAIYDPGIPASTKTYEQYLDAVEQYNVDLFEVRTGDRIPYGDVSVRVLAPKEGYLANEERNENSIVLKITHGQFGFLATGDAEDDGEAYLVDQHRQALDSTLLKAGHHGSRSSTGSQLLEAASPRMVVISSDYDSQYGHPHQEVLDRLAARNIDTYWTGVHGDVVIRSDGNTATVATQREATTNPTDLRSAPGIGAGEGGDVVDRRTYQLSGGSGSATVSPPTTVDDGGATADQLAITEIHADAAGDDRENLNDEYLVVTNTGDTMLDLSGWTVTDEADHRFVFPSGVTLGPGEQLTLRTGAGERTSTDIFWGSGSPIWNNGGDTVTIRNSAGKVVTEATYP